MGEDGWRYRSGAATLPLSLHEFRAFSGQEVQGSRALRLLGGAHRLRRPADARAGARARLARTPGRAALPAADARRLSDDARRLVERRPDGGALRGGARDRLRGAGRYGNRHARGSAGCVRRSDAGDARESEFKPRKRIFFCSPPRSSCCDEPPPFPGDLGDGRPGRHRRPALGGAGRCALPARLPARRLRRGERARPCQQRFLLRSQTKYFHSRRTSPCRSTPTGRCTRHCATRSIRSTRRARSPFVPFAGSEDLSRSHFETQDSIELGQPLGQKRDYSSGFMNRLAERAGAPKAPFPSPTNCRSSSAARRRWRMPRLASPAAAGVDPRQSRLIEEMYRDTPLSTPVTEGFAARDKLMSELGQEMEAARTQCAERAQLRARGAAHRAADENRATAWASSTSAAGIRTSPRAAPTDSSRLACSSSAAASRRSPARWDRAWRDTRGRRAQRVRPHLPRERQPRHRPRPRQRLLRCSAEACAAAASPESRCASSAARSSRTATTRCCNEYRALLGGSARPDVRVVERPAGESFSGRETRRSRARLGSASELDDRIRPVWPAISSFAFAPKPSCAARRREP